MEPSASPSLPRVHSSSNSFQAWRPELHHDMPGCYRPASSIPMSLQVISKPSASLTHDFNVENLLGFPDLREQMNLSASSSVPKEYSLKSFQNWRSLVHHDGPVSGKIQANFTSVDVVEATTLLWPFQLLSLDPSELQSKDHFFLRFTSQQYAKPQDIPRCGYQGIHSNLFSLGPHPRGLKIRRLSLESDDVDLRGYQWNGFRLADPKLKLDSSNGNCCPPGPSPPEKRVLDDEDGALVPHSPAKAKRVKNLRKRELVVKSRLKGLPENRGQEKDKKSETLVSGKKKGRTMFSCYNCSYKTKLKSSLKLHVRVHTKQLRRSPRTALQPNVVYEYQRTNGSNYIVKMPKGRLHPDKQPLVCGSCSFSTKTIAALKTHMLSVHSVVRPFSCPQCAYKAKTAIHLQTHMVTHSEERPFACEHCDMRFKRKFVLDTHTKVKHSDDRPFECPHCDYTCKVKFYLNTHVKTHSDERPFKCSSCSYTSKFRRLMQIHEREVHSQVKPFRCPNCTYRAARNNMIKAHRANSPACSGK